MCSSISLSQPFIFYFSLSLIFFSLCPLSPSLSSCSSLFCPSYLVPLFLLYLILIFSSILELKRVKGNKIIKVFLTFSIYIIIPFIFNSNGLSLIHIKCQRRIVSHFFFSFSFQTEEL